MNSIGFWEFFYQQGGTLKRQQTKPYLNEGHIKNRLTFANKWDNLLQIGDDLYYCFWMRSGFIPLLIGGRRSTYQKLLLKLLLMLI